jgi:ABC-type multidrug transport system ATPase subunit/pSer/pThr/pTyr-binding forkhead associated (FHA) protein
MASQQLLGMLQIQIRTGAWDELPLYQPTIKLGRSKANQVILQDPKVSSQHAELSLGPEGWLVSDQNSSNGTFLDGQRLPPGTRTSLQPGQTVKIGEFALSIRPLRPDEAPPASLGDQVSIQPQPQPGLAVYIRGKVLKFPLEKSVAILGRKQGSDLQIQDPLVSGHHAKLERQGDTYRIVDMDSTNGLTYEGQRVSQHVLSDGDVLYIGQQIVLQYRAFIGFVPGVTKKAPEAPKTEYLDMHALPKEGRRITIGRHSSNILRLDHPRVSRYHAVIEQFGARFRMRDLKSDNGTFVNGRRVEKDAWIKKGDEIRIASFRLIFQEDGITHFNEAGHMRLDALHIEKWYSKTVKILEDVTISIYPKEFVALVGASGAGKSTLMNTMTGFNPANGPQSRVLVNGRNLYTHMDEYRSEMGYVPQEDIIHRELTCYTALDYAAQLRMPADTTKEERHRRVMEVIEELGLTERKDNPITALSGGQRKRVSIGVELLTKPGLFFLDEATSGLDPGTETEMMELLRDLADGGRTVILVTHATKNVMMCDQVVFLARGGHLAYFGPPNEALEYFEQYRTTEERRYQEHIEFDDIYGLIQNRGTPEEWGERFRGTPQYQEYVVKRMHQLQEQQRAPTPQPIARPKQKRQVSAFRQLWILSVRNLRIMAQDKVGLALMLAVAPLIGVMDFIWGKELFDVAEGNAAQVITMLFMMGLIGILTGALSSVREIVKEVEIYRRERTVTLKIMPYVMSKVWIGVILAAYQSTVFVLAKRFLVDPTFHGSYGYGAMYLTIFLCTLSGYMLGLLISAASPNQNIALFLVVIVLVPQFLFAGALLPRDLIPGGQFISAITSTRWAFDGLVRISGIGEDVINDPCWQLPDNERNDLAQDDKDALDCRCMGIQMFEMCYFPGIQNPDFYDEETKQQLEEEEPDKPPTPTPYATLTPYPTLTPHPTLTPYPTLTPPAAPSSPADQPAYQDILKEQGEEYRDLRQAQGDEYQKLREDQGDVYTILRKAQGDDYQELREGQGEEFQDQSEAWGEDLRDWESEREKAVQGAEGLIESIYGDYQPAFEANVALSWLALTVISVVVLGLTLAFQKRKDVI